MPILRLFCPVLRLGTLTLPPEEARHAVSARRIKRGAPVTLFDGLGRESTGTVTQLGKREVEVEVTDIREIPFATAHRITLAVGMSRTHRQGFLIEKCTELGVAAFQPLQCDRSTARPEVGAIEKWRRRAVEACKQSGRSWLPTFTEPMRIESCLQDVERFKSVVMTDPMTGQASFSETLQTLTRNSSVLVFVGPEGGWSEQERQAMLQAGAHPTLLGPHVLRTETAAVAVCAAAAMLSIDTIPST